MKTTSCSNFCRGFTAAVLMGLAPWTTRGDLPVYFNVDFESETIGQEPSVGLQPLPTATKSNTVSTTPPAFISVTNNLFGNTTKFAYFNAVDGNAALMVGQLNALDQPSEGTLRVAMDLAASSLVTTSAWVPLNFSEGTLVLDFLANGKFRVVNANNDSWEVGEYQAGQFTNIEFQISLDYGVFSVFTAQGGTTNVLLSGRPTGLPSGSKFESIVPGPVNLPTSYQFGMDNVVVEMIPEPTSATLALLGSMTVLTMTRRRRLH